MLNQREKEVCETLLETLDDFDLQSLFRTVTQKQIAVENKQEAINAILLCSESGAELLKRQKLKKEHLRDYLMKYKDQVDIPKAIKADKSLLVTMTLKLWETLVIQNITTADAAVSIAKENNKLGKPESQLIAESFVTWFYTILNSRNEAIDKHFWADAKLTLHAEQPGESVQEDICGAGVVSDKLLSVIVGLNVFFNPNISSGSIQSEMNRHGLLAVKTAGTLHKDNCVAGIFEQVFGLVRDPLTMDNWKIKNTELRIRISTEQRPLQDDASLAIASC